MRKIALLAIVPLILIASCQTLQIKDPVKTGLYAIKQEWLAVREYVVTEYLNGRLTEEQIQNFRTKDNQFQRIYDLTLLLRNIGTDNVSSLDSNVRKLRDMLLEARQKYYPNP